MYDFGISGTKRSVSNRGVRKERLDCSYLGIPEIMAYPKSRTGPCTLAWSLDSGLWILVPGLWTYSTSPQLPQRKKNTLDPGITLPPGNIHPPPPF